MTEYNNCQIDAYLQQCVLKQHQEEQLVMIREDYLEYYGSLLDIGCATGVFIKALHAIYPDAHYTGIDISKKLIQIARKKLADANATLLVEDVMNYQPATQFGIIIASGVLSIFDNFEPVLNKWLSWLSNSGRLYIFGRFNSRPIDTIVQFRNHYRGSGWETGVTSYSIHTIGKYLEERGFSYAFKRFCLNIELPESEDPIRTYTVRCADGSNLVLNGANIVAEHYFLTISKKQGR